MSGTRAVLCPDCPLSKMAQLANLQFCGDMEGLFFQQRRQFKVHSLIFSCPSDTRVQYCLKTPGSSTHSYAMQRAGLSHRDVWQTLSAEMGLSECKTIISQGASVCLSQLTSGIDRQPAHLGEKSDCFEVHFEF